MTPLFYDLETRFIIESVEDFLKAMSSSSSSSSSSLAAVLKETSAASSPASIIALYFAASWCPDCVASKPFVSAIFKKQADGEKIFDLIYVASDNNSVQMEGELEDGWGAVAFEKAEERSYLKKHFGVCAQKEMGELGISKEQRKGGIPTMILLEKQSFKVLSTDAIPDLMGDEKVDDPLGLWKTLLP